MWITPVAYSLLELCVVFFNYWFQGSISSEKPWGLAFEEAFPDPQRATGGKVHELSELESFCRFKVRAHTKSRMSLYPVKGIKDVNLSREFYSRMIAICCSSVKLFILLCIFSKEEACMDFAFKSGFSR